MGYLHKFCRALCIFADREGKTQGTHDFAVISPHQLLLTIPLALSSSWNSKERQKDFVQVPWRHAGHQFTSRSTAQGRRPAYTTQHLM